MMFDEAVNLTIKAIVQSDTTIYSPPIKMILILAAGDLAIIDAEGAERTIVFPSAANGGAYPFALWGLVRKVMDTNTTLTDAQIVGYH